MIPARPASAPEIAKVRRISWLELKPPNRAARGRGADDADFEALDGAAEQHRRRGDDHERDHGAEMQAAALDQHRHGRDRIEFGRGRKVEPCRIAPRPAHQIVEQQVGDIDQHQAGQDFAGAEPDLADRRDQRVERARRPRRAAASPAAPSSRRRCRGSSPRASCRRRRRSGTGLRRRCSRRWRDSTATGRSRSSPAASPSPRFPAANSCRSADR